MRVTVDTTWGRTYERKEVRILLTSDLFRVAIPMRIGFARMLGAILMQAANEIEASDNTGHEYWSEELDRPSKV